MKMHQGPAGDTALTVTHRLLTEFCGYNDPDEKAVVANQTLGTSVERIEDLTIEELSQLSVRIVEIMAE